MSNNILLILCGQSLCDIWTMMCANDLCVSLLSFWSVSFSESHPHCIPFRNLLLFPLKYSVSLLSLTVLFCDIFSKTPASLSCLPNSPAEATFRTEKWCVRCACSSLCGCVGPCLLVFVWGESLSWQEVLDDFSCPWTTDGGESLYYQLFCQIVGSALASEIPFGDACLFPFVPAFVVLLIILLPRLPLRGVPFSGDFRSTVRNSNSIILFFVIGGLEMRCMCKIT